MERFVIIVNAFQPLTIITKRSILDVAEVLDPPLNLVYTSKIEEIWGGPCQASLNTTVLYFYNSEATYRSSRSQMFFKIGVLKYFESFTEKYMCWSLFLINLHGCRPAVLLKETPTQLFSYEICEIFKNTFSTEHLRWLLLKLLFLSYNSFIYEFTR